MMIDVRERETRESALDLETRVLGFLAHSVSVKPYRRTGEKIILQDQKHTLFVYKDSLFSRVCSLSLCPNVDISPISTYLLLLLLPVSCFAL